MAEPIVRLAELPMADDRTAAYTLLREAGPVVESDAGYLVTTRELADHVFKNPELFSSRLAFETLGSPVPLIPLAFDPPEHTHYRRLLQPFFTPRAAAALEESSRAKAAALVDAFAGRGSGDVVTELCRPFPAQVFLDLVGLPAEDWPQLVRWKELVIKGADLAGAAEPPPEVVEGAQRLIEYLGAYVARCRAGGGGGILPELLSAEGDDALSDAEALGLCYLFVLAGIGSITDALSLIFSKLAERPELQRAIAEDPSVIPSIMEECMRLDPANAVVPRVATADVELAGVKIAAGSVVNVAVGAACRDLVGGTDPDLLDPQRAFQQLAFGAGPHRCLGINLARVELRVALEEFHKRVPSYRPAGGRPQVPWPIGNIGVPHVELVWG